MKRQILAFLALVACHLAGALSVAAPSRVERPNLIVVLVDDLGWGDFSCFGNREAATPHVDRLAREGIRFSQFYVNAPICSPSRCALTTGQYPQRWRITSYLNNRADNARRGVANWLDPKAPTLARFLHDQGYATGHFGKWHLGGQRDVDDAPPISAYGFDESLTNFEGMGAKLLPLTLKPGDTQPGRIWADAERLGKPVTWMPRSQITGGFVAAAISFIDQAAGKDQPFYINLWPDDVHGPLWPPVDKWADGKRGLYLSVLQEMDRQLGRLFDHVRNNPALRDNTLILVCSDNGHEPGAGRSGPFRGAKTRLYEGGIRSPLIVWGQGLIPPEKQGLHNETSVFAAFDLVPSLLKLADVKVPSDVRFDGEDIAATLVGQSQASRSGAIFWRRPPDRKNAPPAIPAPQPDLAVRDGNWKLLCDYNGANAELYDLSHDLGETTNLAPQQPEVAKRLTAAAVAWHQSLPPDNGPALGTETRQPAPVRPATSESPRTRVSIVGDAFHLNGKPTYAGRAWKGNRIEGLLLNSRMVQATFDDLNPQTRDRWAYPDTKVWDADRNLREFLAAMPVWRQHGLLAVTVNLQGGSPQGYSKEQPWHNSGFTELGALRPEYTTRLARVLQRADELGMVVIVGYFYFGQDQRLRDEAAVVSATDAATNWLLKSGFRNVLVEVNNECNVKAYDHDLLKPDRIHELIDRVRRTEYDGRRLLVGTSYGGGAIPRENVVRSSDFLLLHGNGVQEPERIAEMVRQTRAVQGYRPMPILFNEDDHFAFDRPRNNFVAAVGEYAGWGYFDYRMKDEGFDDGYQSVPANWGISSARKRAFFQLLSEITGEKP